MTSTGSPSRGFATGPPNVHHSPVASRRAHPRSSTPPKQLAFQLTVSFVAVRRGSPYVVFAGVQGQQAPARNAIKILEDQITIPQCDSPPNETNRRNRRGVVPDRERREAPPLA